MSLFFVSVVVTNGGPRTRHVKVHFTDPDRRSLCGKTLKKSAVTPYTMKELLGGKCREWNVQHCCQKCLAGARLVKE